jgi:chemotaxis protein CheX
MMKRGKAMKINAKYVNPFIEAGIHVVKQVTKIDVRRGHLSYKQRPDPSYGVSIIIGVYVGQVVYSMVREVAEKIVEKMLGGRSPHDRKILFVDTLGELANMITGNATAILNQKKDLSLKITTPAIATGDNLSVNLVMNPTLVLGLYSQYGPIEISVALTEQDLLNEMGDLETVLREV